MKTRREMLEDAQRARQPYFVSDQEAKQDAQMAGAWEKAADSQAATFGEIAKTLAAEFKPDAPARPILIPADTLVYVTDKSRLLIPHKLKKDHMFMTYLVGVTPELMTGAEDTNIPDSTNPAELLKLGYYTFETNDRDWPHIIVPRNALRVEDKK